MIDLLIVMAARASVSAGLEPMESYRLTAPQAVAGRSAKPAKSRWQMPRLRFDEEKDCFNVVEKEIRGLGSLRIGNHCSSTIDPPVSMP